MNTPRLYTAGASVHLESALAMLAEYGRVIYGALLGLHGLPLEAAPVVLCSEEEFRRIVPTAAMTRRVSAIADIDPEIGALQPNSPARQQMEANTLREHHLLGVALRWPGDQAISQLEVGEPTILLNVDAIAQSAASHGSDFQTALVKTWLHEHAHVVNGDLDGEAAPSASSAWRAEALAQEHTYLALDRIYSLDRALVPLTRRAQRYMVELAGSQLLPYRVFASQLYVHHASTIEGDQVRDWFVGLFEWDVARLMEVSQPSLDLVSDSPLTGPAVGDRVFVGGDDLLAGPFILIKSGHETLAPEGRFKAPRSRTSFRLSRSEALQTIRGAEPRILSAIEAGGRAVSFATRGVLYPVVGLVLGE